MSCFRLSRRAALAGLAATVAGCGFRPLHGGAGSSALKGKVQITVPRSVGGYRMAEQLEYLLGPATQEIYALTAEMDVSEETSIITNNQETQRFSLIGESRWRLIRLGDDAELASGTARSVASFSASGTTVSTETARRDALDRLSVMLADRIVDQIALTVR